MSTRPDGQPPYLMRDKRRVFHPASPDVPAAYFDLLMIDDLRDPDVRRLIPRLRDCLEEWRDTGEPNLLRLRVSGLLPRAHVAPRWILDAYSFLETCPEEDGSKRPYIIVEHEPAIAAADNLAVLEKQRVTITTALGIADLPAILKTITLGFKGSDDFMNYALVSGIGDFKAETDIKRAVARELGLSNRAGKAAVVNPADFDTTLYLSLQPGMVKPMLSPHQAINVRGICYLKGLQPADSFVAITVSPIDSIIMRAKDFERIYREYQLRYVPFMKLVEREKYDFYKTPDFPIETDVVLGIRPPEPNELSYTP